MRFSRPLLAAAGGLALFVAQPPSPSRPFLPASAPEQPKYAAIQVNVSPRDPYPSRAELFRLIEEAARGGARFVVAPGIPSDGTAASLEGEPIPGPTTRPFGELARRLDIWLILNLPERDGRGGRYLNTVLIDPRGSVVQGNRQVLVRPGPVTRGDFRAVLESYDIGGMRIGVLAGDDIQVGVPRLADRGAETVFVAASWGGSDEENWEDACRELASRFALTLVVANFRRGAAASNGGAGGIYAADGLVVKAAASPGARLVVAPARPRRLPWRMASATGLPSTVPVPSYEPATPEIAELGRRLFFDRSISSTGKISCASCHRPDHAFADSRVKGVGVQGRRTKRNVPSLLNVAFRPLLRWDGYASSLENFAKYPISGYHEMNFHYLDKLVAYVRSKPDYVAAFRASMSANTIEFEHIARALATYQRSLISGESRFDRFHYGGRRQALTASEKRGLGLFTGKARCSGCHLIEERYALLMDFRYHFLGVGYDPRPGVSPDIGLGSISTNDEAGRFQTPSLRNVALTAPYMHDGSIKTLRETIEFFDRGGDPVDGKPLDIAPLSLSETEKDDLEAFLGALTGSQRYDSQGRRRDAAIWVRSMTPGEGAGPGQPAEGRENQ